MIDIDTDIKNLIGIKINKYEITKYINSGSFGHVFEAKYISENEKKKVALKIPVKTSEKNGQQSLLDELKIYKIISNPEKGVANMKMTTCKDTKIMVMDLLGPSLENLLSKMPNRKFNIEKVVFIAIQLIDIMEYIHNCGYIHRDIKADNFVFDYKNNTKIFCIDFGLAKKFIDKYKNHIPFKTDKKFVGTARYASLAAHNFQEQGRKDDLESIGYLLVYLFNGKLKWQNSKNLKIDKNKKHNAIKLLKNNLSEEEICKGMPKEFSVFLKYVRNMDFDEEPPYSTFKKMFLKLSQSIDLSD